MCTDTQLKEAEEKYQKLIVKMSESPEAFATYAQSANDAWVEYKKTKNEYENHAVIKRMHDLYSC